MLLGRTGRGEFVVGGGQLRGQRLALRFDLHAMLHDGGEFALRGLQGSCRPASSPPARRASRSAAISVSVSAAMSVTVSAGVFAFVARRAGGGVRRGGEATRRREAGVVERVGQRSPANLTGRFDDAIAARSVWVIWSVTAALSDSPVDRPSPGMGDRVLDRPGPSLEQFTHLDGIAVFERLAGTSAEVDQIVQRFVVCLREQVDEVRRRRRFAQLGDEAGLLAIAVATGIDGGCLAAFEERLTRARVEQSTDIVQIGRAHDAGTSAMVRPPAKGRGCDPGA